ncbi:MAG: PSD1 and planctomycete cytochrome C domain-containing protein [Isosphaerales bacterium]
MRTCGTTALALTGLWLVSASVSADDFFEARVRPVLVKRCEGCHGAAKRKGGLRVDVRSGWERGGELGPAVVPGKPDESLLVRAVRYVDDDLRMPPKGKLPDAEIATLVEWVKRGAIDPRTGGPVKLGGMNLDDARRWWSFRPVVRPAVPQRATSLEPRNPIDAFVEARWPGDAPKPARPADRRTLIRRATYDLTGLPPLPEEVEAFAADTSADAFERVVDRLLASTAYGERWGRHWLDLVRYADTAGENSDRPLPEIWRYRNWVIDALNRDQPYDEFVRDQVAGDVLAADGPADRYAARVVATGYLAVARRFGHDIEKDVHLTHDDVIDTLGKSVLGLTLGCARCHAHKYDPISVEDYYALYGIFDSTRYPFPGCEPKPRPRDLVPLKSPALWERTLKPYRDGLAAVDALAKRLDREESDVAARLKAATMRPLASVMVEDGRSALLSARATVEPGQFLRLVIDPSGNHGADTTLVRWTISERGGANRVWDLTRDATAELLAGNPHADALGNSRVWWFLDLSDGPRLLGEPVRNLEGKAGLNVWRHGDTPSVFVNATDRSIAAWTTLPARSVFVHPGPSGPVALTWRSPIGGKVSVAAHVADAHPGGPTGVAVRLEQEEGDATADWSALAALTLRRADLARRRAELSAREPRPELAFAVAEGTPHDARILLRGEPEKPGAVVPRRWLELLGGQPLSSGAGSGRRELAAWLTDPSNPLTARVMVNRVWQHHFGRGLVKTPNDFGTRGQPPTHPELLDWLADLFVRSGWRLKPLHRRMMLSDVYQRGDGSGHDVDPGNELLLRFDRGRQSAEEFRDSLLWVAGRLDRTPGGPHPFPPEASWGFTQHNPFADSYPTEKRSVYLMVKRNRREPFLALFDGADPNATTPERQVTTVPTQALFFLNDPFFHEQADRFALRLLAEPDDETRLASAFWTALQRAPTDSERAWTARFLEAYAAEAPAALRPRAAWSALARVLLSSNEFLYLD